MTRTVIYMAHPVAPLPAEVAADTWSPTPCAAAVSANITRALRWLSWLRRTFTGITFVAPWIASILSGEDDHDPAQREAGLVDCEVTVARLDGIVLVGGRIGSGGKRERAAAIDAGLEVFDLLSIGGEPPLELGYFGRDLDQLVILNAREARGHAEPPDPMVTVEPATDHEWVDKSGAGGDS